MPGDPGSSANLAEIQKLRRTGEVSADEFLDLVLNRRDNTYWHQWAMRALLVLGAGHFLSGVVFFFAYNWDELTPLARFALLQSAMLLAFVTALVLRLDRAAGQAALIAASVFAGVLLAVIGQTYQTGADAWKLFAAWTVLVLPWAMASRSSAHWFLWILICLTACSLYGEQRLVALGRIDRVNLATIIGILSVGFLAARELAVRAGLDWVDSGWFRRVLVVIALGTLFVPALQFAFMSDRAFPGLATFVLVSLSFGLVYTKLLPDFSVIAVTITFATLVAMAIGGRVIHEVVDLGGSAGQLVFGLLLLGLWCVALTSGALRLLNYLHGKMNPGAVDE